MQLAAMPTERVLDTPVFHFRIGQLEVTLLGLDTCGVLLVVAPTS